MATVTNKCPAFAAVLRNECSRCRRVQGSRIHPDIRYNYGPHPEAPVKRVRNGTTNRSRPPTADDALTPVLTGLECYTDPVMIASRDDMLSFDVSWSPSSRRIPGGALVAIHRGTTVKVEPSSLAARFKVHDMRRALLRLLRPRVPDTG